MIIMARKGGSWVGDFYERLEAMCVEVEEAICKDTLKYVENQVQNVGVTVKKFYSDVMEDLRAPLLLDEVDEYDDLLPAVDHNEDDKTHDEQNADDEAEPVDAASENLVENCDGCAAACDGNKSHRYCSSAIFCVIHPDEHEVIAGSVGENSGSDNTEFASLNQIAAAEEDLENREESQNTESTSLNQITSVEDLDCREDYENNCVSSSRSDCSTVTDDSYELPNNETEEPSPAHRDASIKEDYKMSHNEDAEVIFTEMVEGNECSESVKEHMTNMMSSENLSSDTSMSSINANFIISSASDVKNSIANEKFSVIDLDTPTYDADKLGASVCETFNKFNLEESCVLVENDDHSSKPAFSPIQRSYKKRIQDVFSRRRWSKSKRDQEVLDAWFEEQLADLESTSGKMQQVERQKSQICESFESDWELL